MEQSKMERPSAHSQPLLRAEELNKVYTTRLGGQKYEALHSVSFAVEQGEFVAVMGASGSGKTTLLNLIASLDRPTAGAVFLEGKSLSKIPDKEMAAFRRKNLGFVFQDFNLLDNFTLKDNILLPLVLSGEQPAAMKEKLKPLAESLGIGGLLEKYPYEVSGGEKQRAAVARAVITEPRLLLADEPTGALDSKASQNLLRIFAGLNRAGQTILMVTHSALAASYASRVLFIRDGGLYDQLYREGRPRQEFFELVMEHLALLESTPEVG